MSLLSHQSAICGTCVSPAEQGALRVVRQAVRQAELVFDQHPSVGSIHVGRLNLGGVAVPVCPVQITVARRAHESETGQDEGISQRYRKRGGFFFPKLNKKHDRTEMETPVTEMRH